MKPYAENIVTFEAMFIGYTEALNRLEDASRSRDPVATYVPLFEALNWAQALDERIRAHWIPNGKHVGYGWRDLIPNGEIMAGVSFARNSVHHDWSDAVVLRDAGVRFPVAFPLSFSTGVSDPTRTWEWIWRDADELPTPGKKPYANSEHIYRDRLQGRTVKQVLDVLGGVFYTLQHMLEPHTIRRDDWSDVPLEYDDDADGYYPPA